MARIWPSASIALSAIFCCTSARRLTSEIAVSVLIWFATTPAESKMPTRPARPNLLPTLLILIMRCTFRRRAKPGRAQAWLAQHRLGSLEDGQRSIGQRLRTWRRGIVREDTDPIA